MSKATTATATATIKHLSKYPKMVQRYFVPEVDDQGEKTLTEVFKVNSKAEPAKGAQLFDVITSTGNTHVFATEVKEVIKLTQADKNREVAKLKAQLESGEIDHQKFADSIVKFI